MAMAHKAMDMLLAGSQQHIHLALGCPGVHLRGLGNQLVGGVALGRQYNDDVVAGLISISDDTGNVADALRIRRRKSRRISVRSVPYDFSTSK